MLRKTKNMDAKNKIIDIVKEGEIEDINKFVEKYKQ